MSASGLRQGPPFELRPNLRCVADCLYLCPDHFEQRWICLWCHTPGHIHRRDKAPRWSEQHPHKTALVVGTSEVRGHRSNDVRRQTDLLGNLLHIGE
jgi:hypothetical protein